ncbi:MAG: hypothetical protein ACRDCW_02490 [Sarcina sp.]
MIRNFDRIENYMIELVEKHKMTTFKNIDQLATNFKNEAVLAYKDVLIHDGNGYIAEMLDNDEIYIWISENVDCVIEFRDYLCDKKIEETANSAIHAIADECFHSIVGIESEDVERHLFEMLKKRFDE